MFGIWNKATDRGKVRHLPVLSTFDVPRTYNLIICMNFGYFINGPGQIGQGYGGPGLVHCPNMSNITGWLQTFEEKK